MKFRLVTTKWTNANKILKDYPQLINKIEVTDGNYPDGTCKQKHLEWLKSKAE